MKTRLFFAAIILSMISFASCTKEGAIQPSKAKYFPADKLPTENPKAKEIEKYKTGVEREP